MDPQRGCEGGCGQRRRPHRPLLLPQRAQAQARPHHGVAGASPDCHEGAPERAEDEVEGGEEGVEEVLVEGADGAEDAGVEVPGGRDPFLGRIFFLPLRHTHINFFGRGPHACA